MSQVLYRFLLGCSSAETALNTDRALVNEVVFPAVASYGALARRLVLLFTEHPEMQAVSLTCLVQPTVQEAADEHQVLLNQHLKLSTMGATPFECLDDKMHFLGTYAPMHRMGTGTVTLERSNPLVQQVLALLQTVEPFDASLLVEQMDACCFSLAQRLERSFKRITVDFQGGQLLG